MAPNKRKAAAVTRVEPVMENFVSNEAKSAFRTLLSRRVINKAPFDAYIKQHGWEAFTHSPGKAKVTLATEFLANLRYQEKEGVVVCRGKQVPLSATVISEYFQLPTDPTLYEPYKKLRAELHWVDEDRIGDWDNVVREITKPEVPLDDILKREKWCNIDKKHLTTEMNVWYTFVAARLMPVTINLEVQWERIKLLYAIKKGIKINVGALIYLAIQNSLTTSSGVGFHSLITGLCHRAGCEDRYEDTCKSPMALLTIEAFQRRVRPAAQSQPMLDSRTTDEVSLKSVMNKVDELGNFVKKFCAHTAKVLTYAKPDAVAAVGKFPGFPDEVPPLQSTDVDRNDEVGTSGGEGMNAEEVGNDEVNGDLHAE